MSSHSKVMCINSWALCRKDETRLFVILHLILFVLFRTDLEFQQMVVVCTLPHHYHIQSNMLDRLLQLVQLYQYQDKIIPFSVAISNELMCTDVVIDDLSRRAYSAMGIFAKVVTQDQETKGDFFGIYNRGGGEVTHNRIHNRKKVNNIL
jgi:hypothetical protein